MHTRGVGDEAEELACKYLINKGFVILERNWRAAGGEIDIIAKHENELYFIEVKASRRSNFDPVDQFTPSKRARIERTASCYLERSQLGSHSSLAVIGIDLSQNPPVFEWLTDQL